MRPDSEPSILHPPGIRILLVEDNIHCFYSIEQHLKRAEGEFDLAHAACLGDAFQRLAESDIKLILLDLSLPDSSGLETLKRLRAAAADVPIIVLTGHSNAMMAAGALRAGAQDYLIKDEVAPDLLIRSMRYSLERQRAIVALRESEERYRQIVETAKEGIWTIDAANKTTFVNRQMADMLGYGIEEMIGRSLYAFMDDPARKILEKKIERRRRGIREQYEFKFRRKDGGDVWGLINANPIMDKEGRYIGSLAMVVDMTERKELELQLRQSQKMEALGRLAGGIAHDFNNLLTAILGYCKLLETGMSHADKRLNDLHEITSASRRAASLTGQLLAFSRKQVLTSKVLNLNTVLESMKDMLRRLINEDIKLAITLDPELKNVRSDAGQIEQVIMNLAVNARDAMPEGGTISIETKNVRFEENSPVRHDVIPAGAYAMIAVSDTGCGMDSETLGHIFEPFFTTKEQGKGTGLGLSTVYGTVKQSGGYLWVYSEPNRGSAFKIYLPVSMEAVETTPDEKAPVVTLRGSETILLAEDNDPVRHMLARILRNNGYKVLEARNGKEAMNILKLHNTIDLVLTDIVMPDVGGRKLADNVTLVRPCARIIFMSGYTDDVVARLGEIEPGMMFIQKPITQDALLRQIRCALDEIYTLK